MSTLPELTVEEYTPPAHIMYYGKYCEFAPTECRNETAYTVTPPTQQEDPRVDRDDEFTTFVCREHLGELIVLRLAGKYPTEEERPDRHEGCHHSRDHDLDCDDERSS